MAVVASSRWMLHIWWWMRRFPALLCKAIWVPIKALYKCNKLLIQCFRKFEYYIRSIKKKDILNRNVRVLKSMFISIHSILGWASFCINYCINTAWHRGNQRVALLRCNEAQVALIAAFRSSSLLGLVSLILLLTIPHRFSMGFRSGEFAGQSSTETPWSLN